MSTGSGVVENIVKILESRDMNIDKKRNVIRGIHMDLPIALVVRINHIKKQAVIEIEPYEDLVDSFADLIESNENIEDVVEGVLGELRDIAVEISKVLENNGYTVAMKITEGEKDVRDMMEEVLEEYREFIEEE